MSTKLSNNRRPVISDTRHYNLAIVRNSAINIRTAYSVGPEERATHMKSEWLYGTDGDFEEFAGASENSYIHMFLRMMVGRLSMGDPRRMLCSELYKDAKEGLQHVHPQVPEGMRKNVVRIARMYILIFLMFHDERPHLLSSLNSCWYTSNMLIIIAGLMKSEPLLFTVYAKAYLMKVLHFEELRIMRFVFVDYIVKTGQKHMENMFDRMNFIGCTMRGVVVCECIREYYQGSSEVQFWDMLPKCKCGCEGLCLDLMNIVCTQGSHDVHLYSRIVMLIYMSQIHGVPFVDFVPNKGVFSVARLLSSWSDNFVDLMEKGVNDQITTISVKARRCNDNIGRVASNYVKRQRAIDGFFAESPRTCLLCVSGIQCALCKA